MSLNIVSILLTQFGPQLANLAGPLLGLAPDKAEAALAATIPSLLAALTGAAQKPGGAAALSDLVQRQDPAILGNLAGALGGADQRPAVDGGLSQLGSLLGQDRVGALAGALGSFTGTGSGGGTAPVGFGGAPPVGLLRPHPKA